MNPRNFFAELKRRNVIRMAGLYLVGAWLLTQVASTLLPAFDAPSWALRGLVITLALGFIPAVIFSWVFELTPQGLKREDRCGARAIDHSADRAADGPHDHRGTGLGAWLFCLRQVRARAQARGRTGVQRRA